MRIAVADVHPADPADIGLLLNRRAGLSCPEHVNTGFGRLANAA
ncbi:hypothetical protein [Streptosporangium sp. NPDC004631]